MYVQRRSYLQKIQEINREIFYSKHVLSIFQRIQPFILQVEFQYTFRIFFKTLC